jgi:hypothetical protein
VSRTKGHLRLVDPLPPEHPDDLVHETDERYTRPTGHPSTWAWPSVDTGPVAVEFRCPLCGKVTETDRPVLQRWCTGNTLLGQRTHVPTEMVRTELRD